MTPDEAASMLEVAPDAEAADILAAYSAKTAEARTEHAADPATAQGVVQLLGEARVTLMTHRQRVKGSEQRTALARRSGGAAAPSVSRADATDAFTVTASGWPEEAPKAKKGGVRSADEEETRKKRSFFIAVIGLILSCTAWFSLFALPVTVLGMGLCIWALIRVRGYGSGMYTGTRVVVWVGLVIGLFAVIGCVLLIVKALGH